MTEIDFIKKVIGKPWSDRACNFEKMDCWGLIVLYYRHVKGIELHHAEGYESGEDFITCHQGILWQWVIDGCQSPGSMVTFYSSGKPSHVGVITEGGKVLHSRGEFSGVRVDHLTSLMRFYHQVEFHKYAKA